jgi:hypothetical protein
MTMRFRLLLTCILTLAAGGLLLAADRVDVPIPQTPGASMVTPVDGSDISTTEQILAPATSPSSRANYDCRLRVFVVEPTSRWTDYTGYYHYEFGFLDFGIDTAMSLAYQQTYQTNRNWTCPSGLGSIDGDNIMVIAMLYSQENGGTNYSNPPSSNPFTIHVVDAAAAAIPGVPGYDTAFGGSTHTVFIEEATQQG